MKIILLTFNQVKYLQRKFDLWIPIILIIVTMGYWEVFHSSAAAPSTSSIKEHVVIATTGRALERALYVLGNQLHCVINYEDPPYEYPPTIKFLTPDGPAVPTERSLYFAYNPKQSKVEIIQSMIDEYQKSDDSVVFELATHENQGEKTYSVTPSQVKTKDGTFTTWESPLDKKISLSLTDTCYGVATHIAELAAENGIGDIQAVEGFERNDFYEEKVSFNAENKTARSCLNSLIIHYNSKHENRVTWGVNRDPIINGAFIWFQFAQPIPVKAFVVFPKKLGYTVSLYVESGRPLAKALRFIERQSAKAIIYEGSPYLCPCSVMRDHAGKAYNPSGGIFDFAYSSQAKFSVVLATGLKEFNKYNVGEFIATLVGSTFYVHPTVFMDAKEKTLPHKPLLETTISLSSKGKTVEENLKELCAALTAQTPYKVSLGELPSLPLFTQIVTEDVTKQPAVEYLSKLSQKTGDKLSWQLLYMPKTSEYVLNADLIDNHS